ncbi:MAG: cytochrome c biogenesis protein ResB [Deltaproteobacteria bacterium]|nr:cytochrome c biogenesis protein ResB [Deltaproteobacteria bacterium]
MAVAQSPALPAPSRIAARRDVVEWIWETGASLKPTIPILILVALACVLGTFANPDNASLNDIAVALAKQQGTFMGLLWRTGLYSFFELNDLFHSWWFLLLLVLLSLNLTACTIDRLPRIYTIALKPHRQLDDSVLRGLRHKLKLPFAGDPAQEAARLAAAFKVRGFEATPVKGEDGAYYLFGERGRFSRFGVYVVHAALLCILGGGIAGRFWGYEGTINVFQDKGTFDFVFLKNGDGAMYKHELPVAVRVTDFRHTTYKDGSDKGFESDLQVLGKDGAVVHAQTISVGHPMKWAGWTFYQASYQAAQDRSSAKVTVVDKVSGARTEFKVRPDDQFGLNADIKYRVVDYQPDFSGLGPAVHVQRQAAPAQGGESDFWVFQNNPAFDRVNREDRYALEFGGIQQMYFTGLQVARDPGAAIVFSGCILMFFGLFVAFYTSHRRLWAKVTAGEVLVAGAAHKNHFAFANVFESLEQAVRGAAATKPA